MGPVSINLCHATPPSLLYIPSLIPPHLFIHSSLAQHTYILSQSHTYTTNVHTLALPLTELADPRLELLSLDQQEQNKRVVTALYQALSSRDVHVVQRLLASDLEWWFHGPPTRQHLMRLLTGRSPNDVVSSSSFKFSPISIAAFGSIVVVEGYSDDKRSGSWVHAWTLTDGVITQVREYFNTSVTVTLLGSPPGSPSSHDAISSPDVTSPSANPTCQSVWQSKLCDHNSVPGLVLAL